VIARGLTLHDGRRLRLRGSKPDEKQHLNSDHPTLPSRLIPSSFCASTRTPWELLQHFLGEAVDDEGDAVLRVQPRLMA
jgi:hypothetical protein